MNVCKSVFLLLMSLHLLLLDNMVFGENDCDNKKTCRDCIQEFGCSWCPKTDGHHCQLTSTAHCSGALVSPNSSIVINKDIPLSDRIQMRPQKMSVKIRRNQKLKLIFSYQQSKNYPVDLYYLMDLSWSMRVHKNTLATLGISISEAMKRLTNDFRLGFGSFIDKPTLPYVNVAAVYNKEEPVKPYSYKHHLSLTDDFQLFNDKVKAAKLSENIDAPEGGLDALMQAMVCDKEIGWRPQARKMIVFSTDAGFHVAGDGKLAGIVEPNDGRCHMRNNAYEGALQMDYPSIGHISKVASNNSINLVFAVGGYTQVYEDLSKMIVNSNVGTLDKNSNNVVSLIQENYEKIVDSVTMTSDAPDDIAITFIANCPHKKENGCNNVLVGSIIDFEATIKAEKCTPGNNKHSISLKPVGLAERISLDLEVICGCDCDSAADKDSAECNLKGDKTCGVCECKSGRYGDQCECDGALLSNQNVTVCQAKPGAEVCSGLGVCTCNQCVCNKRKDPKEKIYGEFCQCNNYNCISMCSGHGDCDCGECKCHDDWSGPDCGCAGNATCFDRDSEQVCSGHGVCSCGKCGCEQGYIGRYCEECWSCPSKRCEELGVCVECQLFKTGIYNETECQDKCKFQAKFVDSFDGALDRDFKICSLTDEKGCRTEFHYKYNDDLSLVVEVLKEKKCTAPPNILAWIISVIASIIVAGLIMLIIWKIFTTIHDRREYAKFESEKNNLKWNANQNPLYRDVNTTTVNPFYKKNRKSTS